MATPRSSRAPRGASEPVELGVTHAVVDADPTADERRTRDRLLTVVAVTAIVAGTVVILVAIVVGGSDRDKLLLGLSPLVAIVIGVAVQAVGRISAAAAPQPPAPVPDGPSPDVG